MTVWDRFRHVVGQGVAELVNAPDAEGLLHRAVEEMERELGESGLQEQQAQASATRAREMHALRLEEAAFLVARVKAAEAEDLKDEAARLTAAHQKALLNAQTLEADAVKAEQHAAQLKDAVAGLRQLMEDARSKQAQVKEQLGQLRKVRQQQGPQPQVAQAHGPPPRGSGLHGERTMDDAARELEELQRRSTVEDALSELKRKMQQR